MSTQKIGLIVGKFYPLHQGHINMILSAKLSVDELHVFVCSETKRDRELYLESAFTKAPTSDDRVQWAKLLLQGIEDIIVHGFNEDGIPAYPNGWQAWSDRLKATLIERKIKPTMIFSSELQDKEFYEAYFETQVTLVDPPRDAFPVSATKIRNSPFQYWTYIPTLIRPFFTKTIIIEEQLSSNNMLVPAISKLFNAVEVLGYEKISFQAITSHEITNTIKYHLADKRRISAIIGTSDFIQTIKTQTRNSELLHKCLTFPIPASHQKDQPSSIQERALFNEISSFINRLIQSDQDLDE